MSAAPQSIRPLSVRGLRPPSARPQIGPEPVLQWIETSALFVDFDYQRDIADQGRANIARIAGAFDWANFSPLMVAPLEGGDCFVIIDGQHRTTAAMLIGIERVPCMVVAADKRKQAAAFAAINGNVVKMSALMKYRAALGAGDPAALQVDRIAKAAGVRVLTYPRRASLMKPGDCCAPAILQRAILQTGETPVFSALLAIMASRGDVRGLISPLLVQALAGLFAGKPLAAATIQRAFARIDLRRAMHRARLDGAGMGPVFDLRSEIKAQLAALAGAPARAQSPRPEARL